MTDNERTIIEAWEADAVRLRERAAQLRKIGQVQGGNGSRACDTLARYAELECARLRTELTVSVVA